MVRKDTVQRRACLHVPIPDPVEAAAARLGRSVQAGDQVAQRVSTCSYLAEGEAVVEEPHLRVHDIRLTNHAAPGDVPGVGFPSVHRERIASRRARALGEDQKIAGERRAALGPDANPSTDLLE